MIEFISIHAPVKGATSCAGSRAELYNNFNPRTREGCDGSITNRSVLGNTDFNPRTREGCDVMKVRGKARDITDFNPRTREGCDGIRRARCRASPLFQSTHP